MRRGGEAAAAADAGARASSTIRDLPPTPLGGRVRPTSPAADRSAAAATIVAAKPEAPWPTGADGATAARADDHRAR